MSGLSARNLAACISSPISFAFLCTFFLLLNSAAAQDKLLTNGNSGKISYFLSTDNDHSLLKFKINFADNSQPFLSADKIKTEVVENPLRLVIDLIGNFRGKSQTIPVADSKLIRSLRIGNHPDKLRFVLDFNETDGALSSAAIKSERSPDPSALILNIGMVRTASEHKSAQIITPSSQPFSSPQTPQATAPSDTKSITEPPLKNTEIPLSPTFLPTVIHTSTAAPTATATVVQSMPPSISPSPAVTPTASSSPTATQLPSSTAVSKPSFTSSPAPSATFAMTKTASPSATITLSPSATITILPSATHTTSPSSTATRLPTGTATLKPSGTPSKTATATHTPTVTRTTKATNTATATITSTPSPRPSNTPSATPSIQPTATYSPAPSATPVALPTINDNSEDLSEQATPASASTKSSGQEVQQILFEYQPPDSLPIIKIQLSRKSQFKLVKRDEGTFILSLPGCTVGKKSLSLPQFPPQDFIGFRFIQSSSTSETCEVLIGVDRGTRVAAFAKESEIIIRSIGYGQN